MSNGDGAHLKMTGIDMAIMFALQPDVVEGLSHLASVIQCNNVHWVRERVRILEEAGVLKVERPKTLPGRGDKVRIVRVFTRNRDIVSRRRKR